MPTDASHVRFVIFDVDGTLYDQSPVRSRMARALLAHSIAKADPSLLLVLRTYRELRETMADQEIADFEPKLIRAVAIRFRRSDEAIQAIVSEWMERRPLPYLRAARFPGLDQLFEALRRSGRRIGVWSDYPAAHKLAALGLAADYVASAADPDVRFLKPNPRGLEHLMALAHARPSETILIGDRVERDGEAGRRAKVRTLLRSPKPLADWECFSTYPELMTRKFFGDPS